MRTGAALAGDPDAPLRGQIRGNLELTGPLSAPSLTGRVDIAEANLRPDLAFLAQSSTPINRDQTIAIVNRDGSPRPDPTGAKPSNGLSDGVWFSKLTLDLDLRMPRNVWVRHPDAVAELRGNLRAAKKSGQDLQLVGSSDIVRGWAAFQGRRFDFVRGEIRFIGGGKIDPALDIVAQHRLPLYTVNALVGGTAENPSLVLRSDRAFDQADILSLLVFGKTTRISTAASNFRSSRAPSISPAVLPLPRLVRWWPRRSAWSTWGSISAVSISAAVASAMAAISAVAPM